MKSIEIALKGNRCSFNPGFMTLLIIEVRLSLGAVTR